MCGKNPAHYAEYWKAVQELWLRLYLSNLVLIAAINVSIPTPEGPPWLAAGQPLGWGWTWPCPQEALGEERGSRETLKGAQVSLPLQTR